MKRIAIVGLGQIGGSLVLSLRKNKAPYHITGIDPSKKRVRLLRRHLDASASKWEAAQESDLVILCLHFQQILQFLQQAPQDQLITDVCSGKAQVLQFANRRHLKFVGGHPMAGNEFAGEKGWQEDLFKNAPYFLCPGKYTVKKDVKEIQRLVKLVRAKSIEIDAKEHDRFVAKSSHFPAFLSIILKELGKDVPVDFQGPGFRSMVRLAKTPSDLLQTFLDSNRENIFRSAKEFDRRFKEFFNAKTQRRKV
jgi:prephenate dehydrogenase